MSARYPVLFLVGERDSAAALVDVSKAYAARRIRGSKWFRGAGRPGVSEQPARFAAILRAFLQSGY